MDHVGARRGRIGFLSSYTGQCNNCTVQLSYAYLSQTHGRRKDSPQNVLCRVWTSMRSKRS